MVAYNNHGSLIELGGKTNSMFGTCSVAEDVAAKVVTLPNFASLQVGATIRVKFTNSNTAENPTLNVNSTGAKPIMKYGSTVPGVTPDDSWQAGSVLSFTYDGTNWMMIDQTGVGGGGGVPVTYDFVTPGKTNVNPITNTTAEILDIYFNLAEATKVNFSSTINFSTVATSGTTTVTVTYRLDDVDSQDTLTQTYADGYHILTLSYLMEDVAEGDHTFAVKLTVSGGTLS